MYPVGQQQAHSLKVMFSDFYHAIETQTYN